MTRVLVTGCWSRQANPSTSTKDVTVAWLIAEICRDLGFDVEHRDPKLEESYEDFDHVFLGLAPLHSLGCNRSYGALAAFLRTYQSQRVSLYFDDYQTQNVENGIQTWYNNPDRGFKPFYVYRKEYEKAVQPEFRRWLLHGVDVLRNYAWPTTLIPAFPWADQRQLVSRTPRLTDPVFFDPTAYLPVYASPDPVMRTRQWVSETKSDGWIERQRIESPIVRFGKGHYKRPIDEGLVRVYESSMGVLDLGESYGWWNSRIGYAAQTKTPYATQWQNVVDLGDAYSVLADDIEAMSDDEQRSLGDAQLAAFAAKTESRDAVREKIRKLVEVKVT